MIFALNQTATAESERALVNQANKLYAQDKFNDAINKYDQAITENPDSLEPRFNKADSYYRLDDLANAMSSYEEVAAKSKDMKLVAKAKYNLGNSYFQRGSKQKDSDLQKAIDDFKTSIGFWRSVLDIQPDNEKAAKNIEVARLVIKDLIDQLNKQKQNEPNQPHEPNQSRQQKQNQQQSQSDQQNQQQEDKQQQGQQKQEQEKKQQQQKGQQKEPNKPADANQPKQQNEQQKEKQQEVKPPDATAQEILDNEQKQRKERQMMQPGQYQKVDKDW
jgi:Ca-activated chloride channel family protein